MTPIFDRSDFDQLSTLFDPEAKYKGYKPDVLEIPNGDGRVDAGKRFLHVALKYDPPEWALRMLARAHFAACGVAERAGLAPAWRPAVANGTLRVLYYPQGTGSEAHCDFDLFTLNCWRDPVGGCEEFTGAREWRPLDSDVHYGELWRIAGMGSATPHRVIAQPEEQRSIIYFASPSMNTPLPERIRFDATPEHPEFVADTTGAWQIERTRRSRKYA